MQNNFTLREMERMDAGLPPWESMSFACGGWLQFYMFGVGKALQESGLDHGVQYAGCSAGALTAAGLALEGDFDAGVKYAKEECITVAYKSLAGLVQLHVYVGGSTDNCLLPFFTKEKSTRVQFAATSALWLGANRLKDFESKEDFKSAILASCAAFPAAKTHVHRGTLYVDGGVSDFQPVIDSDTITVSPFYFSNCDIKPSRYVPLWWAFLPPNSPRTVDWLYSLGYEDCLQYIKNRKILDYMNRRKKDDVSSCNKETASAPSSSSSSTTATTAAPTNTSGDGTWSVGSHQSSSAWDQLKTFIRRHRAFWSPSHPYDQPNKVSLHRFLGYDLHTFTNYYVAFALDLYLLLLLLLVWKPLALCLIYFELLLRIVYLNLVIVLKISGAHYLVERLLSRQQSGSVRDELRNQTARGNILSSSLSELSDCVRCVFSLSLVLRFFSGRPTPSVELRKHDRLAKHSLLYRVFRHII